MSTLHDLVHHGIQHPHAWPVIADAFEEHGHPDTAEVFRSKRLVGQRPRYAPENVDDYDVTETWDGNPNGRIWYTVHRKGDREPLSTHHSEADAQATIEDMVSDKNSTHQEYIDHVRENGKEIAPGVHLVDDGRRVHLHDFRHLDSDEEYDPDTVNPVATFVKGKQTNLSRRTDKSKRAKITGLTSGGDCEHCGKKDVALIHVKGEESGKEIKLGSTCAGKLCHTTTGEKLHREKLVRHGHSMNTLKKAGHEPVYPTIMYDSEQLQLARHVSELAHEFNPEKKNTAYADALAASGHPLALFARRAKVGLPLIRTTSGHGWAGDPGKRGNKESHVPRARHLEAPDLGIHRVGFHYDPETDTGHVVVNMQTSDPISSREITWHAPATKQELRDLGLRNRRMKLARPDVVAQAVSSGQSVRRKLAAKIAVQAGLKLQQLLDARTQSQAGVLQTYGHENEPDAVDYAAAWYGLLSRSPRLTSFHVHNGGPDTYHSWKTSLDPDRVLEAAKGLGLNAVVTSAGNVAVLDIKNQATAPISALKEATYANAPISEPGTAKPFGSRDDYRDSIRAYERSVLGNRPSAPPTAGQPAA